MKRCSFVALAAAAALFAGCAGPTSGVAPLPVSHGSAQAAPVQIQVFVPALPTRAGNAARFRPYFVASTTAGVLVQTYAQSDTAHAHQLASVATDVSSGSAACGGTSGTPRSCTVAFLAPPGADTFVLTSYDASPVAGAFSGAKQLGAASVNATIVAGTPNTVHVTLGGILASLAFGVTTPQLHGTVATTQTVLVNGYDADGNLIVSDGYVDSQGNPLSIALSITPNTGNVFTLGAASLASPALGGVSLAYDGLASAAFTATLHASAGSAAASTSLSVLGPAFTQYLATAAGSAPSYVTQAPGSVSAVGMWFTDTGADRIGVIDPTGTVTEYSFAPQLVQPVGIATAPLGTQFLWVTDESSSQIAAITATGTLHGIVATATANAGPYEICAGPDGNLWYTERNVGKIGRITETFSVSDYATGFASSAPTGIAAGPDGNLWFTDPGANEIGKMTTGGAVTGYTSGLTASAGLGDITAGPDGNLWFTETSANKIGKITPSGNITEYSTGLSAASQPVGITEGNDGKLWFVERATHKLGSITTTGTIAEYASPATGSLTGIATGADGNLWFAESGNGAIGSFSW